MKEKSIATLTVHDAAKMTTKGRREIVKWLKRQIETIEDDSDKLASRWTARYIMTPHESTR